MLVGTFTGMFARLFVAGVDLMGLILGGHSLASDF